MARPEPRDPLDLGLLLGRAFDRHGVPYALGGALAYGIWAVPRGTMDVDVNVFVHDAELPSVFAALQSLDIEVDVPLATHESAESGLFVVRGASTPFRIDVFTPSIAFSWEAFRTRVAIPIDQETFWFLSAEALAVFKLLFFRSKDLVDLERLVAVQGEKLDAAYVRAQIVDMMGEGDPRVQEWDRIVSP